MDAPMQTKERFKPAGLDFGNENDVGLTWSILEGLDLRLQYARYDPGPGTSNPSVRKTWLTLAYTY